MKALQMLGNLMRLVYIIDNYAKAICELLGWRRNGVVSLGSEFFSLAPGRVGSLGSDASEHQVGMSESTPIRRTFEARVATAGTIT